MNSSETTEFDPAARRLCPDGACTGLVASEGVCSECGRFWGEVAPAAPALATESPDPEPANLLPFPTATADSDGFDPNRALCPDGACTGVIGENGRCSECGRYASRS